MKKLLATSALALTLAGTGALGIASAAGASTTTSTPTATAPAHHGLATWLRDHRHAVRAAVVSTSATAIGVTPQDLVTELKGGSSIAQVAAAHNVSSQTVVDSLVKVGDAKVASVASAGKISAARAQAIEARLPTAAAKVVAHVFGQHAGSTPAAS